MDSWLEWDTPQPKEWGVSPPRSLDGPVDADLHRTRALEKFLDYTGISKGVDQWSDEVLSELFVIANSWVESIAAQKAEVVDEIPYAVLFTFGSFRLGVNITEDDIDILCVGPSYVDRELHFFGALNAILGERNEVIDLRSFPDAHVPAMKFKYKGKPCNLIYASIPLPAVPNELYIYNNTIFCVKDPTSARCLDMCRVSNKIIELVPYPEVFQIALRFLKYWAKRRGIYSNETGFLGGTHWALLVARICQAYPSAVSSMIVSKFFEIYDGWCWPKPVMLDHIYVGQGLGFPCIPKRPFDHIVPDKNLGLQWDPEINLDKLRTMPIISPAYPCKNLGANVSVHTLGVVKEQFKVANKICQTMNMHDDWHELCQPFLEAYPLYLHIKISASDDQDLEGWKEWIKSLWRELPSEIDVSFSVLRCHLNTHEYLDSSGGACIHMFIGLSRKQMFGGLLLETSQVSCSVIDNFERAVRKYKSKKAGMRYSIAHVKKSEMGKLGLL